MINAVVAVAKNDVIGKSNDLPWYLPADLKRFKELTIGHTVIMGRATYDSIIHRLGHPLPDRKSIVLSRDDTLTLPAENAMAVTSIEAALQAAPTDKEVFVIGGAQIYELASPIIARWYMTEVDAKIDGEVYLRGFDAARFTETLREHHEADAKNQYSFDFVTYEKK